MEFYTPRYLSEAFDLLDQKGEQLKIGAGMTHLLRFYSGFPKELPDRVKGVLHIGELTALSECKEENGKYQIGATSRIANLEGDVFLARYAPSILDAARATSTPQIRNRRTVGGEIAWGSYHCPLIVTLMALEAKVRVRLQAEIQQQPGSAKLPPSNQPQASKEQQAGIEGREETWELTDYYEGKLERTSQSGKRLVSRAAKTRARNLLMKIILPDDVLHRAGHFNFFRALTPKISTENSGVVLAVSGVVSNGIIQNAQMVASGLWMWTLEARLPLEGVKMSDAHIFEKLYSFCDRYPFDKFRREGPSGNQLGLVVFALLKEGFSGILGR